MILEKAINDFRANHGRNNATFNRIVADHCFAHCMAMAQKEEIYHAEQYYRRDWSEAVAMASLDIDYENCIRRTIFDDLGRSELHKNIMLNNQELAVACFVLDYRVFITIRGR